MQIIVCKNIIVRYSLMSSTVVLKVFALTSVQ